MTRSVAVPRNGSVQFSRSVVSDSLRPHESQHTRPPCPSPSPGVHSDSRPSSPWCHPVIASSVVPFSSCPQSLPASESFPVSQLFTWGGRSTGALIFMSFSLHTEESKLLHFANRKTPFCKVPGKEPLEIQEPLEIPWPHPTTHKPIGPQTKISWLNTQELVVYLDNRDQSRTNIQPFERKWPIDVPPHRNAFFPCILPI